MLLWPVYSIKAYRGLRVDWDEDLSKGKKVEAPKPVSAAKPVPVPAAAPAATLTPAPKHAASGVKAAAAAETSSYKADLEPLTVDKELERRQARAAKWGTEIKQLGVAKPAPAPASAASATPATSAKPAKPTKIVPAAPATDVSVDVLGTASHSFDVCTQDADRVKARQARFGTSKESTKPITTRVVDEVEARKRKAREERFGINPGVCIVCFSLTSDSDTVKARSQKASYWPLSVRLAAKIISLYVLVFSKMYLIYWARFNLRSSVLHRWLTASIPNKAKHILDPPTFGSKASLDAYHWYVLYQSFAQLILSYWRPQSIGGP